MSISAIKVRKTGNLLVFYQGYYLWISKYKNQIYDKSDIDEWNHLGDNTKDTALVSIKSSPELIQIMDDYLKEEKVEGKIRNIPHTQTLGSHPEFAKLRQSMAV